MNKPTEKLDSPFMTLAAINVNGHTEKKGKFTYLSWPFAVSEISKADPSVTWEYPTPVTYPDGTMMVFCNVTAFGKTMRGFLPVMDNRNQSIPKPNAMDINKAMQRCLVKAIALHGLGLYIYSGEDLPEEPKHEAEAMAQAASQKGVTPTAGSGEVLSPADKEWLAEHASRITEVFKASGADQAIKVMDRFDLADVMDNKDTVTEAYAYRWSLIDSKCRSAITKARNQPTAEEITAQA